MELKVQIKWSRHCCNWCLNCIALLWRERHEMIKLMRWSWCPPTWKSKGPCYLVKENSSTVLVCVSQWCALFISNCLLHNCGVLSFEVTQQKWWIFLYLLSHNLWSIKNDSVHVYNKRWRLSCTFRAMRSCKGSCHIHENCQFLAAEGLHGQHNILEQLPSHLRKSNLDSFAQHLQLNIKSFANIQKLYWTHSLIHSPTIARILKQDVYWDKRLKHVREQNLTSVSGNMNLFPVIVSYNTMYL